jgi:hypothetical protein
MNESISGQLSLLETQLQLIESLGDRVRFPHSIMQAYLGSRLIGVALQDPEYYTEALENPGREFLIALLLHSRALTQQLPEDEPRPGDSEGPNSLSIDGIRDLVMNAANSRRAKDAKGLDLFAAALEIDAAAECSRHSQIAENLANHWHEFENGGGWQDIGTGDRTIQEAKLGLVGRFGDAVRAVARRERSEKMRDNLPGPAYKELYKIACYESSYPVRLAIAQEIGAGGDEAFKGLADTLSPPKKRPDPHDEADQEVERGTQEKRPASGRADESKSEQDSEQNALTREEHTWRNDVIRAWLAPLLVGSITMRRHKEAPRQHLEQWLGLVGKEARRRRGDSLSITCEIALAQGFKYAANCRAGIRTRNRAPRIFD